MRVANKAGPTAGMILAHDFSGRHVHDALIIEARSKLTAGWHFLDAQDRFVLAPGHAIPKQVVPADAGAMAEQVADSDQGVGFGIGQVKIRQVLANGIVPVQLAVVHQHCESQRGEGFGAGGEWKDCVSRDWVGFSNLTDAVAFEVSVFRTDDDKSDAGNVPEPHCGLDFAIDGGGIEFLGAATRREREKGREESQ